MKNRPSKTAVSVRLDTKERDELDTIAEELDRDRSYLINEAIGNYLELHRWQVAHIRKGVKEADAGRFARDAEVQRIFRGA